MLLYGSPPSPRCRSTRSMPMQTTYESQVYGPSAMRSKQREPASLLTGGAFWGLAGVGIFLCVMIVGCARKAAPAHPNPPDVEVTTVIQQDVPNYIEWVSQLNGPV